MSVLVDSSVWIDYFQSGAQSAPLDTLIDENLIVTNELILAELIPVFRLRKQHRLIKLLEALPLIPLEIVWVQLMDMHTKCLRRGINRIGIPDLIIAQQAVSQKMTLYTLDKHFRLMKGLFSLTVL